MSPERINSGPAGAHPGSGLPGSGHLNWRGRGACLVALALTAAAFGNEPREFLIQSWTKEHGIPGTTVTALAQTPDGYLWLGTFAGLAQFDGVRFVTIDLRARAGVAEPSITCLQTDREGRLWIGTSDGHLIRVNRGVYTTYLPPSRQSADRYVQRLAQDASGDIWTLNYEGGLCRQSGTEFKPVAGPPGFMALIASDSKTIWAASANQLFRWDETQLRRVWDAGHEPGFQLTALAPARQGGCWVVGNGQVRRFEKGEPRETLAKLPNPKSAILGFLEDREGSLWVGTYGDGVSILDSGGKLKRLTRRQGLPSDLVRCLFEDREGNLWIGMEGRGLARVRRALFAGYGKAEGATDETVLCAREGRDGAVWIGSNGDGVYAIRDEQILHYGVPEGLTNQFVWSLNEDRQGRLWAGTWGGGLFRLTGSRFENANLGIGPGHVVLALHEDRTGTMWLGERTGLERVIETFQADARQTRAVPGRLPRLEVRSIAETRDGSIWFGTTEEGLLRYQAGDFTHFGLLGGLPTGGINTLEVDDDGALWLAMPAFGLVAWDEGVFRPVPATRELLGQNLNQITDDGNGYLWCGTGNGVVRLKKSALWESARGGKAQLGWQRFSKADGLPGNECSGSGFRARDGRLWFPTLSGIAVVDPRHLTTASPPLSVLIEEALVGGARVFNRLDTTNETPAAVRIAPGSGPVDLVYTALSFAALDRVSFRYQLVGSDEQPVAAGSSRVARYNHLPPGHYEFKVMASVEGGEWKEATASLALEMLPHYWETSWFRVLAVLAALGATAAIARVVILRRLERRLAILERQRALEAERSRISQDLHDDLGTSLMEIKFLSTVAGRPSSSASEVKDSLSDISHKSSELVKALDEIVWAVNPKNDSLRNLVNYLCLYAQEFLRAAAMQCRLDVPQGLPDFPLNAEQRHTLFLVTKEALANAAKHSGATELWLRVALQASRLTLVIEDNGHGFDPATLSDQRNGLKNITNRMQQLGGAAAIQSRVESGTRIELSLPLQ